MSSGGSFRARLPGPSPSLSHIPSLPLSRVGVGMNPSTRGMSLCEQLTVMGSEAPVCRLDHRVGVLGGSLACLEGRRESIPACCQWDG